MQADVADAFQLGAGFSAADLYLLLASLLAAGLFVWGAWSLVGHYRYWADGGGAVDWLLGTLLAMLIALLMLVHFL